MTGGTVDRLPWLKWIDRVSLLLAVLGGVAAVMLMLTVVVDVIGRVFFNSSFTGTLDLTTYAFMPTMVSLGLGYALLRGEHIRVNLLTAPTGSRVQRIIEVVGMVCTLGTTALFIVFGSEKAVEATGLAEKASGTPWLEIWPFRWMIVVGLAGLFLQALAQLLRAVTVAEFTPSDEDEDVTEILAEETVLEELAIEPAAVGRSSSVTEKEGIR